MRAVVQDETVKSDLSDDMSDVPNEVIYVDEYEVVPETGEVIKSADDAV